MVALLAFVTCANGFAQKLELGVYSGAIALVASRLQRSRPVNPLLGPMSITDSLTAVCSEFEPDNICHNISRWNNPG